MPISDDDLIKACAAGELIWDRDAVTYRVRGDDVGASISGVWRHPSKIRLLPHQDGDRQIGVVLTGAGRERLAELEPPTPTHEITIAPSRPDLLDWHCSCGEASGYDFGSFGRATDDAIKHVPDDAALTVTRPNPSSESN